MITKTGIIENVGGTSWVVKDADTLQALSLQAGEMIRWKAPVGMFINVLFILPDPIFEEAWHVDTLKAKDGGLTEDRKLMDVEEGDYCYTIAIRENGYGKSVPVKGMGGGDCAGRVVTDLEWLGFAIVDSERWAQAPGFRPRIRV